MKKLLLLTIILVLVFTMGACSQKNKSNTPENSVEAFLDSYKNGDIIKSMEYVENKTSTEIEQIKKNFIEDKDSKSSQAFLKTFSKIEYKIINSDVKKDFAIINTEITAPNLSKIIGQLIEEISSDNMSTDSIQSREDTLEKMADMDMIIGDKLLEKINSDNIPMVTKTINIKLVKKNGSWLIKTNNEFKRAITGNLVNTIYFD
ncbi:hypothetical protein [Clostridiisalibacter paucivorans]|uniref:hypothetical protein n=1 Tax=Clostridiisalibacter paucivorans TaxID=408753 RepID=UPI00047C515A|nr:hypothetical protein [Clostridiisalibacter paucivorans]